MLLKILECIFTLKIREKIKSCNNVSMSSGIMIIDNDEINFLSFAIFPSLFPFRLVDVLRDFGKHDWQLSSMVCQILWNYR